MIPTKYSLKRRRKKSPSHSGEKQARNVTQIYWLRWAFRTKIHPLVFHSNIRSPTANGTVTSGWSAWRWNCKSAPTVLQIVLSACRLLFLERFDAYSAHHIVPGTTDLDIFSQINRRIGSASSFILMSKCRLNLMKHYWNMATNTCNCTVNGIAKAKSF